MFTVKILNPILKDDTFEILNKNSNAEIVLQRFASNEIFDPYNDVILRADEENENRYKVLDRVIQQYIQGQYDNALLCLDTMQGSELELDVFFLKSLIYFKSHKYSSSRMILLDLKRKNILQEEIINWNIIMCLINSNQIGSAEFHVLLNKLESTQNPEFKSKVNSLNVLLKRFNIAK